VLRDASSSSAAPEATTSRKKIVRFDTPNKDRQDYSLATSKQIFDATKANDEAKLERICKEWAGNEVIYIYKDNVGKTALMEAAIMNYEGALRILIAAGTNIDATNRGGNTALHLAAFNGHAAICRILVDEGASLTAKDLQGNTALDKAKAGKNRQWAACVALLEMASRGT